MWVSYSDLGRDLRPGDKVRIVDEWVVGSSGIFRHNFSGQMDKWLGSVVTISSVHSPYAGMSGYYRIAEDCEKWSWFPEMISCVYVLDTKPLDDVSAWQNPSLCSLFD